MQASACLHYKKMIEWIGSYQNHILYSSAYACIVAFFLKSSQTSNGYGAWFLVSQLGAALSALFLYGEINYVFQRSKLPPGDSGLPLVGGVASLFSGPREFLTARFQKYGSLSTFNLFMRPALIVSEDEDVSWWLMQERKSNVTSTFLPHILKLLGDDAIVIQTGARHRSLRRIMEPTFAPAAVKDYVCILDETIQMELKKWSSKGDFNPSSEWNFLAMRLFFVAALGGQIEDALLQTINDLFVEITRGITTLFPFPIPGNRTYKARAARKKLGAILLKMVDDFKAKHPAGSKGAEQTMLGRLCYGVDDEGNHLSNDSLVSNIQFILFAGYDTTKGSFCAFAHYLTKMPDLCEQIRQEVMAFPTKLTADGLKSAPLLNAFLAETWRVMAPLHAHQVEAKQDIDFKGYRVKKGSVVMMDIQHHNMRDDGRYKNPWEFRVDRWLPEGHPMHNPEYYQFGVDYNVMSVKYRAFNFGSHMCLGGHFAKLEARLVLTRLLQGYDLEIQNDSLTKFPLRQYQNEFLLTAR